MADTNKIMVTCKNTGVLVDTKCPVTFVISSANDFISQAKTHYENHTEPGSSDRSAFVSGINGSDSFNSITDEYIGDLIRNGKAQKY